MICRHCGNESVTRGYCLSCGEEQGVNNAKARIIIQAVAIVNGVTLQTLCSRKRDDATVKVRQKAMYQAWRRTDCTLAQIGELLGERTPATVSYGIQRAAETLTKGLH